MRKSIFLFLLTASALLAQNPIIPVLIGLDEHGTAWMGDPSNLLPCSMLADPGPGGLASALTCDLASPPAMVPGDLILTEGGNPANMLRFNSPGTVVIYSDNSNGVHTLADTGFPLGFYTNPVTMQQVNNGIVYTPNPGDPGFVFDPDGNVDFAVTYQFTDDANASLPPAANPEPATVSLFVVAGGVLIAVGRRRKKSID
ncbi:MAG TPA: PEP-CTERM sorting domain-containing protein [Bryobacteraceae bacterium]|jgi:hypothetical protein